MSSNSPLNNSEPRKALLAEDCQVNSQLVTSFLRDFSFEVTAVSDGAAALEKCGHTTFDLIVMDIQMPRLSGFEAIKFIRGDQDRNTGTPIVVITGYLESSDEKKIRELGVTAILFKPFRKKDFSRVVTKLFDIEEQESGPIAPISQRSAQTSARDSEAEIIPPMNFELALSEFDDDMDIFRDVLRYYVNDSTEKLRLIIEGLTMGDLEQVRKASHTLRGSSANLRAEPLAEEAAFIEKAVTGIGDSPEDRSEALSKVTSHLGRMSRLHTALLRYIKIMAPDLRG